MGIVWIVTLSLLGELSDALYMPKFLCVPPYVAFDGSCIITTTSKPRILPCSGNSSNKSSVSEKDTTEISTEVTPWNSIGPPRKTEAPSTEIPGKIPSISPENSTSPPISTTERPGVIVSISPGISISPQEPPQTSSPLGVQSTTISSIPDKTSTTSPGTSTGPPNFTTKRPGVIVSEGPGIPISPQEPPQTFSPVGVQSTTISSIPDKTSTKSPGTSTGPPNFTTKRPGVIVSEGPGISISPQEPPQTSSPLGVQSTIVSSIPGKISTISPGTSTSPPISTTERPGVIVSISPGISISPQEPLPTSSPVYNFYLLVQSTTIPTIPGKISTINPGNSTSLPILLTERPGVIVSEGPGTSISPQEPPQTSSPLGVQSTTNSSIPDKTSTTSPGSSAGPPNSTAKRPGVIVSEGPGTSISPQEPPQTSSPLGVQSTTISSIPDKTSTTSPGSSAGPPNSNTKRPGVIVSEGPGTSISPQEPPQTSSPLGVQSTTISSIPDKTSTTSPGSSAGPPNSTTKRPGVIVSEGPGTSISPQEPPQTSSPLGVQSTTISSIPDKTSTTSPGTSAGPPNSTTKRPEVLVSISPGISISPQEPPQTSSPVGVQSTTVSSIPDKTSTINPGTSTIPPISTTERPVVTASISPGNSISPQETSQTSTPVNLRPTTISSIPVITNSQVTAPSIEKPKIPSPSIPEILPINLTVPDTSQLIDSILNGVKLPIIPIPGGLPSLKIPPLPNIPGTPYIDKIKIPGIPSFGGMSPPKIPPLPNIPGPPHIDNIEIPGIPSFGRLPSLKIPPVCIEFKMYLNFIVKLCNSATQHSWNSLY
ncbi:mucin-5AC [Drosophila suzukii]|uniref:Mucin-5AC n=1 Tax=Drosophila suzukii TaxID=28584 RepID=A0ABM4TLN4_DROSZ